jgi:hypothetical protein
VSRVLYFTFIICDKTFFVLNIAVTVVTIAATADAIDRVQGDLE